MSNMMQWMHWEGSWSLGLIWITWMTVVVIVVAAATWLKRSNRDNIGDKKSEAGGEAVRHAEAERPGHHSS